MPLIVALPNLGGAPIEMMPPKQNPKYANEHRSNLIKGLD